MVIAFFFVVYHMDMSLPATIDQMRQFFFKSEVAGTLWVLLLAASHLQV
jgi:hypothetical protein